MWLVNSRRLGHRINRGSPRGDKAPQNPALVTVRDKRKVKPEFSTLRRPKLSRPHAATCTGQSPGERLARGVRLRIATPDPHVIYATDRINDIRGSPSCTVGVVKLGEGVGLRVTPGTNRYPSLAAGFRRRALFFEPPPAPNQSAIDCSGHFRFAAWILDRTQVPTSLEPWKRTIETTMPTGLAVTRGQSHDSD